MHQAADYNGYSKASLKKQTIVSQLLLPLPEGHPIT